MYWFLGALVLLVVTWAALEHYVAQRRKKRDPYYELNDER